MRDVEFLRSITEQRIKITVPGPFTMTQQAQNDHYADDRELALAYAEAVNEELRDLKAAGADVVQIDEPYLQARPRRRASTPSRRSDARSTASTATRCCTRASAMRAIVHDRPSGYPFLAELNDCAATHISLEAAQPNLDPQVLRALPGQDDRARRARPRLPGGRDRGGGRRARPPRARGRPPERLVVAPDCGMKYLPRELAFRKLEAMVAGARAA